MRCKMSLFHYFQRKLDGRVAYLTRRPGHFLCQHRWSYTLVATIPTDSGEHTQNWTGRLSKNLIIWTKS
jgi:hypothetical protein